MPSEKIKYIRQRMKDTSRTDIKLTPLKAEIEAIFNERNIDDDCDTIASLLSPYRKMVRESLSQGNCAEAITILLEVLESLTYHFVEDEHYDYFDDMYSPDYVCQDMMKTIIDASKKWKFPSGRIATIGKRFGKIEAYRSIRGLRCAVCFEYMGEV